MPPPIWEFCGPYYIDLFRDHTGAMSRKTPGSGLTVIIITGRGVGRAG